MEDKANLHEYTRRRDQYRRAAGRPDRWSDNTLLFAGRSWRRVSPLTSQLNCRILFDKHVHGGNVKKWKLKSPFSELCPICQQTDSQTHWLRDCPGFHQVALRHTLQDKLQDYYRSLGPDRQAARRFAQLIASHILTSGNPLLWLGNWNTQSLYILKSFDLPTTKQGRVGPII